MRKNQHVVPSGDKWGIKGEGSPMQLLLLVKFPRTSIPNYLFTVVMDGFEKGTLMERTHFPQKDKFLSILSV